MALSPTGNLKRDLAALLNCYSLENGSDTPDFLLADYLLQCLAVFDVTIAAREQWYGRPLRGAPALALGGPHAP